ncbi:hypothetical protein GCK72_023030 [Caenorhabditis remanei]|uniref:Uncharacterized protein n=1 Tax=Caenorhabditis remanei TaxID=31234 RepID=A0A6A5FVK4_CAERE|nr:hypothetical protein GCK72_023030 [Caenorhabditis remanei]KAF1746573.1 hypothetical protein GCK72_023030 [Caenorhabditis remanei]
MVVYTKLNNVLTGENISIPINSLWYEYNSYFNRTNKTAHYFLYKYNVRYEDKMPIYEPDACVAFPLLNSNDEEEKQYKFIHVGERETFSNGSVRVRCDSFNGSIRRISEPVKGCYSNGTVHEFGTNWNEPNYGDDTISYRDYQCQKSKSGYMENKVVGCSYTYECLDSFDNFHSCGIYLHLNEPAQIANNKTVKCIEKEDGNVTVIEVNEYKEHGCTLDGQFHSLYKQFINEKRAAVFSCRWRKELDKQYCTFNGKLYVIGAILKLSNGCLFICHKQTNIFHCDHQLSGFEVIGKPRRVKRS